MGKWNPFTLPNRPLIVEPDEVSPSAPKASEPTSTVDFFKSPSVPAGMTRREWERQQSKISKGLRKQ